jgi:hypothetical protein
MKAGLAFLLKLMRWQEPKIDFSNTHATNQNSRSPNCPNLEIVTFQHSPSIDYTEAAILGTVRSGMIFGTLNCLRPVFAGTDPDWRSL